MLYSRHFSLLPSYLRIDDDCLDVGARVEAVDELVAEGAHVSEEERGGEAQHPDARAQLRVRVLGHVSEDQGAVGAVPQLPDL